MSHTLLNFELDREFWCGTRKLVPTEPVMLITYFLERLNARVLGP